MKDYISAITLALLVPQAEGGLIAGTYNIRNDNPRDTASGNAWTQRLPVMAGLIRFHRFDVLGTQEALHHQLEDLQKLLPGYAYTGCGREDGHEQGEYTAIFYRQEKFRLLGSGDFWLSPTPEVVSKGWDAEQPRICTWVKLAEIDGGGELFVFNTHFDHRGKQARLESARLIMSRIQELAGGKPTLLVGDFNVTQTSGSYRALSDSDLLADSFETAKERYALNGTSNGFDPNRNTDKRIDHVFHSAHFKATRYGVLTDTYRAPRPTAEALAGEAPAEDKPLEYEARLPSDHFPVLVEFE